MSQRRGLDLADAETDDVRQTLGRTSCSDDEIHVERGTFSVDRPLELDKCAEGVGVVLEEVFRVPTEVALSLVSESSVVA